MARNKRTQDRDEKRAEIVATALKLFVDDGYDSTSIGKLASAAGITTNTIYWYFQDKDAVLVEVLNMLVAAAYSEYETAQTTTLTDRVLWLVGKLEKISELVNTVHARALVSDAVRIWHNNFHAAIDAILSYELAQQLARQASVTDTQLNALAKIWTFTIEGILSHQLSDVDKRAMCETLAQQLDAYR
ncbi:MAG: TetR/AcrR family transcriptional regulator [Mycobacterium sp.]